MRQFVVLLSVDTDTVYKYCAQYHYKYSSCIVYDNYRMYILYSI